MQIKTFPLGSYQTNCYMVWSDESDSCVLIDPGFDADFLLEQLEKIDKKLDAILLTHGHFDHVGAVNQLSDATDCEVYICKKDLDPRQMLTSGPTYYTHTYPAKGAVTVAGLSFELIYTPGHTPGSVCLQIEDVLFTGDTLFAGTCGRTDLPGGNHKTLMRSLDKLYDLPGDFRVLPGHGPASTLQQERDYNPFMQ